MGPFDFEITRVDCNFKTMWLHVKGKYNISDLYCKTSIKKTAKEVRIPSYKKWRYRINISELFVKSALILDEYMYENLLLQLRTSNVTT